MELIKWLLDYIATKLDAILTYKSSDMVLAVHSDASYLSEANAHSRVSRHFFCSTDISDPPNNGVVLNISKILKAIMSSAAKAKLGALSPYQGKLMDLYGSTTQRSRFFLFVLGPIL
jgi:hypothetical protein